MDYGCWEWRGIVALVMLILVFIVTWFDRRRTRKHDEELSPEDDALARLHMKASADTDADRGI